MNKIQLNLKNSSYPIFIGSNIISDIKDILSPYINDRKIFIITDKNVENLYLDDFKNELCGFDLDVYVIEPGEKSKSIEVAKEIFLRMLEFKCDRKSVVITFGGGVVGDLGGYVASTYMRGIDYIQIPTTLLSQVDSSIGGKVAVNINNYKNIVGNFHHPLAVVIDIDFLKSLNIREFNSGLGEVLKYGLIKNFSFLQWVGSNIESIYNMDKASILKVISESLDIKKEIVQKDEREGSLRKILNFGHTIGHGIEGLNHFKRFTHGEAVALGMIYETKLSLKLGLIEENYYSLVKDILSKVVGTISFNEEEINEILEGISHDKKLEDGQLVLVLPTGQGIVEIVKGVEKSLIIETLKEGIQ